MIRVRRRLDKEGKDNSREQVGIKKERISVRRRLG